MTMLALHRRSLLGFVALGPLGLMSGSPLLLGSGLVLLAVLAGSLRSFGTSTPSMILRVGTHVFTTLGLFGALVLFRTDRVDAVLLILLLGLANRLVLRAGQRDDFLLIALTSTMIAAATTVTPGIEFLLIVVAAVPGLVLALWSSELLGSLEKDSLELERARRRPAPRGMGRWVAIAAVMTLLGTAFCALFPRYKFSQILGAGAFVRLPGASDSMRIDDRGASDQEDETVVLRVHPMEGVGPDALLGLYARLYSLEDFDGVDWTSRLPERRLGGPRVKMAGRQRAHVQLVRQVASSAHPVAVLGRDAPFALHSPRVKWEAGGHLVGEIARDRQLEYDVALDAFLEAPVPELADGVLLDLPGDLDPRFSELSARLVAGATSNDEKTSRVLAHFERGYTYSTEALQGTEKDPLVRFVFQSKRAHCELYAAAVAVLLRSAGVPARVATGYYGGRWNRVGGYLAFVQGDAHAWVEVWSEANRRWRWIDATPEDLRGRRGSFDMFALARDWYDSVSALWYERVVDFDGRKQRQIYESALTRLSGLSTFARGLQAAAKDSAGGSGRGVIGALALGVALVVLGIPFLVLSRRRRRLPALGQRLRKALGADREADQSATLGRLLERQPSALRSEAQEAVRRYERHRFGAHESEPVAPVVEALCALETKRRQTAKARD